MLLAEEHHELLSSVISEFEPAWEAPDVKPLHRHIMSTVGISKLYTDVFEQSSASAQLLGNTWTCGEKMPLKSPDVLVSVKWNIKYHHWRIRNKKTLTGNKPHLLKQWNMLVYFSLNDGVAFNVILIAAI